MTGRGERAPWTGHEKAPFSPGSSPGRKLKQAPEEDLPSGQPADLMAAIRRAASGSARAVPVQALLYLQRAAGNRAVAQLVTREARNEASPPRDTGRDPVVQRKFGIEIEIPLAVTAKRPTPIKVVTGPAFKPKEEIHNVEMFQAPDWPTTATATSWDTGYDYPKVGVGPGYDVKMDHNAGVALNFDDKKPFGPKNDTDNTTGAIVELVTHPIEESASADDVEKLAKRLQAFAENADYSDGGRKKLRAFGVGAKDHLYTGYEYGAYRQKKQGALQATYGIRLDRIPALLQWQAAKAQQVRPGEPRVEIWRLGAQKATDYMGKVPSLPATTPKDREQLQGLLTMVCTYLAARGAHTGVGWGKNKLGGLFYKSKLNDVTKTLHANIQTWLSTQATTVAADLARALGVFGQLIVRTRTCEGWVEDVLRGTEDLVFEENKNPYAEKLGPETVGEGAGTGMGAVMENRVIPLIFDTQKSLFDDKAVYPVSDWAKILKRVHSVVRLANADTPPTKQDLDVASSAT